MGDTLLRRIPAVDVKLDEFMFIPVHHSYNSKDFMTRVFGQEPTITIHSSEYQSAIKKFSVNSSVKNSSRKPPKYLIKGPFEVGGEAVFEDAFAAGEKQGSVVPSTAPNLILLHNAMILRPKRLRIPTVVSTTTISGPAGKPSKLDYITAEVRNLKAGASGDNTWNYKNAAFKTPKGFIEQDKFNDHQTWIVREALEGKAKSIPKTSLESEGVEPSRDAERFGDIAKNIRKEVTSVFKLAKNQPFFVQCRLHRMPDRYKQYARSSFFKKASFKKFYPDELGSYTSLELEWGGGANSDPCQQHLKLVIRGGAASSMTLYRKTDKDGWKQYGRAQSLPQESVKKESHEADTINLTIYPMSRHLLVISGEPSTEDTLKGRYVVFNFDELVSIPESGLKMHFYGGKTEFGFNPIMHVAEGKLISPPVGVGFDPALFFLKVDYEGKFVNDYFGDKNSTSPVPLPLPTKEDMGGCGNKKVTNKKGETKSSKQKKTPFYKYLEGFVKLEKLTVKDGDGAGADEDLKALFSSNQNKKTNKSQFKYQIKLSSATDVAKRIYSPIIYKVELQAYPRVEKVNMGPSPQIDNADVRSVEITQGVEEISGAVMLWNRYAPENRLRRGPYTFKMLGPKGNFTGVKPITIKGGIGSGNRDPSISLADDFGPPVSLIESAQPIQMKGFISSRNYSRPSSSESYCELSIEDVSKQAKEQFAVNLPIFDGWCNLAVIYTLAKEAGYTDDQILFSQDPRKPDDVITIKEMLEAAGSDVEGRQGGCFAGHVPKFPQTIGPASRVTNLPPSTIHALMPLNAFREQPAYMFQMGRSLWECMQEIREFTGFFLYPNIHGSIIYSPAEVSLGVKSKSTLNSGGNGGGAGAGGGGGGGGYTGAGGKSNKSATGGTGSVIPGGSAGGSSTAGGSSPGSGPSAQWSFHEISGGRPGGATDYSQYQSHLDVPFGTGHVRNAVMTFALISAAEDPTNPAKYTPVTIIKKQPGWPFNVNDPSYVPWLKWLIVRSPHWNDFARAQANTAQRFIRGIQPRTTPTFGAWGHALLYPYDVVQLNEEQAGETGIDGVKVIVQEVTKTFDAEEKSFTMELNCEYVNFSLFEWSPHENQSGPAQTIQR